MKPIKEKTCKYSKCGKAFTPFNSMQKTCRDPKCALGYSREREVAKAWSEQKAKDREWKRENPKRGELLKRAQRAFNGFIRARDSSLPCVSCNRFVYDTELLTGSRGDCGHYRSTGAASHLRFNCWNTALQCVKCNRDLSGNVVDYRVNLVRRIGVDRVEALENNNEPRSFDAEYLRRVATIFNRRARHYRRLRGL